MPLEIIGDEIGDEYIGDEIGDDIGDEMAGYEVTGAEEIIGEETGVYGDDVAVTGDAQLDRLLTAAAGALAQRRRRAPPRMMVMAPRPMQRPAPRPVMQAPCRPANAIALRNAVAVRNVAPTVRRDWPLPLDSGISVPNGQTFTITIRPQMTFRVERLVIESDHAGDFLIQDVKVGNRSQFGAAGSIPARIFQENANGVRLRGDTAQPGIDISVTVFNKGGSDQRFSGAIIGAAVA